MTARKQAPAEVTQPAKATAAAHKVPATRGSGQKATPSEVATVDRSARFTEALARGFSIKAVNDELFAGTSFSWRARRGPVDADRDADLIKKLTAWLDGVESGKIAAPQRVAAAAGGPNKRELAARVNAATAVLTTARDQAKSNADLRRAVGEALVALSGDVGAEETSD